MSFFPGQAKNLQRIMEAIYGKKKIDITIPPPTPPKRKRSKKRTPPPDERIAYPDAAEFFFELVNVGVPPNQAVALLRDAKTRSKVKEAFGLIGPTKRRMRPRSLVTGEKKDPVGGSNSPASILYGASNDPLNQDVLEYLIRNYRKEATPYIKSLDLFKES